MCVPNHPENVKYNHRELPLDLDSRGNLYIYIVSLKKTCIYIWWRYSRIRRIDTDAALLHSQRMLRAVEE